VTLPTTRKKADSSIQHYKGLLYGREKIGKTTLLSRAKDTLFLTTEPGTEGLEIFEITIDTWTDMMKAVRDLEEDKSRFQMIVVDTADRAYDKCLDKVCRDLGIDYPGENAEGSIDYGKSWRAVRMEFLKAMHRIIATGRGLWLTSHAKEEEIRPKGSRPFSRIYPSMSKQARQTIEAFVDIVLYAEKVRDSEGHVRRVLICEGDETVFAGARAPAQFPPILPMEAADGWSVIERGWLGQHPGLDPASLKPIEKVTSTASAKLLTSMRARKVIGMKPAPARQVHPARIQKGA